jgi:hypothetical protein
MNPAAYPAELDVILSTGLGEFLPDDALLRFYATCRAVLRGGGVFVTSGTRRDPVSDYLMRELAELRANYRDPDEIVRLLRRAGFHDISARLDETRLQTLVVARRSADGTTNESGGKR